MQKLRLAEFERDQAVLQVAALREENARLRDKGDADCRYLRGQYDSIVEMLHREQAERERLEGLILDAAEDQHAMNTGINSIGDLVDEAERIRAQREEGR
jgi:hypothetical protein